MTAEQAQAGLPSLWNTDAQDCCAQDTGQVRQRTAVVVAADNDVLDTQHKGILQAGHHIEVLVVHEAAQVAVHKDAARGQVHGQIRLQHACNKVTMGVSLDCTAQNGSTTSRFMGIVIHGMHAHAITDQPG